MKKLLMILLGLFTVLGPTQQASAEIKAQAITGSQSAQENGCVDAIGIFTDGDCSYNGVNRWWSNVDSYTDLDGNSVDTAILTETDVPVDLLANISINVLIRSKKTRLRFGGIYLSVRDEDSSSEDKKTTEENFTLKSKYDYFFSRKMFG